MGIIHPGIYNAPKQKYLDINEGFPAYLRGIILTGIISVYSVSMADARWQRALRPGSRHDDERLLSARRWQLSGSKGLLVLEDYKLAELMSRMMYNVP